MRIQVFPNTRQHLLTSLFFIVAILIGVKSYLFVVLIYISLMIDNVKHFFIYPLAICMSLEKCLFKPLVNFLIELLGLGFFFLELQEFLNFLEIKTLYHLC